MPTARRWRPSLPPLPPVSCLPLRRRMRPRGRRLRADLSPGERQERHGIWQSVHRREQNGDSGQSLTRRSDLLEPGLQNDAIHQLFEQPPQFHQRPPHPESMYQMPLSPPYYSYPVSVLSLFALCPSFDLFFLMSTVTNCILSASPIRSISSSLSILLVL